MVAYPAERANQAVVCGPTGDNPPWLTSISEPACSERWLRRWANPTATSPSASSAETLEGGPDEHPGCATKGFLATHELLYGVPRRTDWNQADGPF